MFLRWTTHTDAPNRLRTSALSSAIFDSKSHWRTDPSRSIQGETLVQQNQLGRTKTRQRNSMSTVNQYAPRKCIGVNLNVTQKSSKAFGPIGPIMRKLKNGQLGGQTIEFH